MTTANHLEWLLYLMADNPEAWKHECWRRAKQIAKDWPEHADLPRLLEEAMKSGSSKESGTRGGSS